MAHEMKINKSTVQIVKSDVTDLEIESFVYYAQHDLALGSGFGTSIALRGGRSVQEELDKLGPVETTGVVVSGAGEMKAERIIHAVGPRFQEEDLETKLKTTILNCLKKADESGIKAIAFPAMGTGFYGVPLDLSAAVTLAAVKEHLSGQTAIEMVVVCLNDNHEYRIFEKHFQSLRQGVGV
jgi:O-acetyl-ADP-ribose deacetylase (regulator of RNase III)